MHEKNGKFIVVGAGLPRTGTLSTRSALKTLLHGEVYHGLVILAERTDHHHLWRQAVNKTISREGWQTILSDYVAGVDNPIAHFYKEIIEVYPDVKVLLNVRDPDKWYQSVRDSILKVSLDLTSWPCSWFAFLMGDDVQIVWDLSEAVPSSSSSGLGLFSAVMAGRDTALEFYNDHVEEVKNHVPEDQLLVFNVKQGWEPLCKFLDLPIPDCPFPRVNDTEAILSAGRIIMYFSWLFVVFIPLGMLLASLFTDFSIVLMILSYLLFLLLFRLISKSSLVKALVVDKMTNSK